MVFPFQGLGVSIVMGITLLTFAGYLFIAFRTTKQIRTINNYFIADRQLSPRQLKATYLGTNITFTSIFIALAAFGYTNGVITFWILVWWLAGMAFFYWVYPRIDHYFQNGGQTLHEFLGKRYQSRGLRVLASLVTVAIFTSTMGLELFGGVFLLSKLGILPVLWPTTLALIIALMLVIYTVLGGFKATVKTDIAQMLFIVLALVVVGWALNTFMVTRETYNQFIQSEWMSVGNLLSDPVFIIAMLFMFFPFQICVMDMWQRCAAVGGKVNFVRNMIKVDSIGFIIAYAIPIMAGIAVKTAGINLNDANDAFFVPLISTLGPWAVGIVFAGLFAAMLSTADTLLICAAHSLVRDVWGNIRNMNLDNLSPDQEAAALLSVRLWTIIVGVAAVGIMVLFNWFSLYDLVIAVFSAQIVFFVPLLVAIFWPRFASTRSRSAAASIIVGFLLPILVVWIGKTTGNQQLINGAPIAGFLGSIIIFFGLAWWKRRPARQT